MFFFLRRLLLGVHRAVYVGASNFGFALALSYVVSRLFFFLSLRVVTASWVPKGVVKYGEREGGRLGRKHHV